MVESGLGRWGEFKEVGDIRGRSDFQVVPQSRLRAVGLIYYFIIPISKSLAIAGIFTTHLLGRVCGRGFEEL